MSINNEPYQVISVQHIKVAQRQPVRRSKLKNLLTGATLEKTFSAADTIEGADLAYRKASFLYRQEDNFLFMDSLDFEQFQFSQDSLGSMVDYLKEGQEVDVLVFNDKPVAISLPPKIVLEVVSAPDGVRGNSAGVATKTVILETGLEIRTPLFIKDKDKVIVNTETGEYVNRA